MEAAAEESFEAVVEFEDIQLSDSDDRIIIDSEGNPLNIDYNSRLVSKITNIDSVSSDNCDTRFFESKQFYPYAKDLSDKAELTSSEEIELSDDDKSSSREDVYLQNVDLEGVASVSSRHQIESSSSFDFSSTTYKEECFTDAEYISEEETDSTKNQMVNGIPAEESRDRKLSFGLSVSNLISTVKDVFSSRQTTLSDLNVMNPFASSVEVRQALPSKSGESKTPLMTCLEFLKSEPNEDELTDIEDFSPELCDNKSSSTTHDLEDVFRYRGKASFKVPKDDGRSSWTLEMFSDDEASPSEATKSVNRQRHMKRNSLVTDSNIHSLTDEELFDFDGPGDAAFDSDDLLGRSTTTTTTRIVTTVTTGDSEDGDQEESGTEDLRHSVEVILNQFMSDGDSKQEDSHLGSEE